MFEVDNYERIINKFKFFDHDSIQFYININTIKSNKVEEKCAICLENNTTLKMNCCEGYFHNECLYETFKYKNKKIKLEYKSIKYLGKKYEFLTNDISNLCPICRRYLDKCDIEKEINPYEFRSRSESDASALQQGLSSPNISENPNSRFAFGSFPRIENSNFFNSNIDIEFPSASFTFGTGLRNNTLFSSTGFTFGMNSN